MHVGNTGTRSDPRCGDKLDNKDFVNSVRHVKCELEGRWISIHHENPNGGDKILTICELEAYGVGKLHCVVKHCVLHSFSPHSV